MAAIKLPMLAHLVEIYEISKITNPKSKLSVIEKINHLIKLQNALLHKLEMLRQKRITPANSTNIKLPVGGSIVRDKQSSMKEANDNSDIEEEAAMQSPTSKSVTPMTADTTSKTGCGVGDTTETETGTGTAQTATYEDDEDDNIQMIKAAQKKSKRARLIDEE